MSRDLAYSYNLRDLSYLPHPEGKKLKEGLFYRSSRLNKLSKEMKRFLKEHDIRTVIDLRTPGEIAKKPDIRLEGITYHEIPILSAETMGITHERGLKAYKEPPDMNDLYASLAKSEASIAALRKALDILLDPKREGGVLWHCTAGKDRAGLLTAVFLSSLGYEYEQIESDYVLSNPRCEKQGKMYRRLIKVFLPSKRHLAEPVYRAMLAAPEYLRSAYKAMEEVSGSVERFLGEELGVTAQRKEAFYARFGRE